VVLIIIAGIFTALVACVLWMQKVMVRYLQLSQLRELTGEYIVQDLAGQFNTEEEELKMQGLPAQQHFMPVDDEPERVPAMPIVSVEPNVQGVRSASMRQSLLMDLQAVYGGNANIAVQ